MTDQSPEFRPEVPEQATDRIPRDQEETPKPSYRCATCADKGVVGILFESAAGPVRKSVACPDGPHPWIDGSQKGFEVQGAASRIKSLEDTIDQLRKALILAIMALAAIAYLYMNREQKVPEIPLSEGVSP